MQEVFLEVLHQDKDFCSIDNARAWLFQVARNLLIDRLRLIRERFRCRTICLPPRRRKSIRSIC